MSRFSKVVVTLVVAAPSGHDARLAVRYAIVVLPIHAWVFTETRRATPEDRAAALATAYGWVVNVTLTVADAPLFPEPFFGDLIVAALEGQAQQAWLTEPVAA